MQTSSKDIETVSWPRLVVLTASDVYVLARFRPRWTSLVGQLREPQHWVQQVGTDRAAITIALALLWLAACWLALGVAAAGASRLPGQAGRIAAIATGRLMPQLLQRLLVTAASASIVFTPVAATAATPTPGATPSQSIVLNLPTDGASAQVTPTIGIPPASSAPVPDPAPGRARGHVLVRPGDSLWTITGRQLEARATPAEIAAAWPRLYAANRAVIGADPGLLRTGENLTVPASVEGK